MSATTSKPWRPKKHEVESDVIGTVVRVKVGLDEWAVIPSRRRTELITDGLSSCVAIVIMSNDKACLMHLFSDADHHWDKYEPKIKGVISGEMNGAKKVALVTSDDFETSLLGKVRNLFDDFKADIEVATGTGVQVFYALSLHQWSYRLQLPESAALYRSGYENSESSPSNISASGFLSASGAAAG